MMTDHVDVPFDAPQTLAFRAPAGPFMSLRDGLRAAYERGDGALLREQWQRLVPAYRDRRRAMRWRVPAETMRGLLGELRAAADIVKLDDPDVVDRLAAQIARWERLAGAAPHLDVDPDRWLPLVCRARVYTRPLIADPGAMKPLGIHWDSWTSDLERLAEPSEDLEPDAHAEVLGEAAPAGAIERTAAVTFYLEDYDDETGESRRGKRVPARRIGNAMRDIAVLADGEETTPHGACYFAESAMRLRGQLELVVGPLVRSGGPGPFLAVPPAARSIVDPAWSLLDIYRAGRDDDRWSPPPWWFASGAELDRAIGQVSRARPGRDWIAELDEDCDWGQPAPPSWLSWDEVAAAWAIPAVTRYRRLLEEARAAGDVVVFTLWVPDDQGTILAPLADDLGAPVRV